MPEVTAQRRGGPHLPVLLPLHHGTHPGPEEEESGEQEESGHPEGADTVKYPAHVAEAEMPGGESCMVDGDEQHRVGAHPGEGQHWPRQVLHMPHWALAGPPLCFTGGREGHSGAGGEGVGGGSFLPLAGLLGSLDSALAGFLLRAGESAGDGGSIVAGFTATVESGVVPQEEGFRAGSVRLYLEGVRGADGGAALGVRFAALESRFGAHHEEGGGAFRVQRMRGDGGDAGSWCGVAAVCHRSPPFSRLGFILGYHAGLLLWR